MYLELHFEKMGRIKGQGWELYRATEVTQKTKQLRSHQMNLVYLDDVSFLNIPTEIDKIPVVSISNSLRISSSVQTVIIPDTVKEVGFDAFRGAHAKQLKIGAGVKNIDFLMNFELLNSFSISTDNEHFVVYEDNLYNADKSTLHRAFNADIWDGTKNIYRGAFNNFYADSLILPSSVESLSFRVFNKSTIDRVHIPFSVKSIAEEAFYECTFESLFIASEISEVAEMTFYACKIGLLVFKDEIDTGLSFRKYGIYACSITSLILPSRTNLVETSAFKISNLQEVWFSGKGYCSNIFVNSLLQLKKIRYNLNSKGDIANLCFGHTGLKYLLRTKSLPLIVVKDDDKWMEEMYW